MAQAPPQSSLWLTLASVFQVAVSPPCLVLAFAGVLLTSLAGISIEGVLPSEEMDAISVQISTIDNVANCLESLGIDATSLPIDPVIGVPATFVQPIANLFATGKSWLFIVRNALTGFSHLAVWSFFGLAIVRISVLRFGTHEHAITLDGLRFAQRKWLAVLGAPIATLFAAMLMAIPVFSLSWLIRYDVGMLLVSCIWIVVLAFAGVMTVLAVGLAFSWPLMWGAIAAEDSDLFDAISRSFAYALQRPAQYLFYATVAASLGLLGWILACFTSEAVVQLAYWTVQVGGGAERIELLRGLAEGTIATDGVSDTLRLSGSMIGLVNGLLTTLVSAFSFAFFWASAGAIYLLLRFDTDQTQLDDIVTNTPRPTISSS